MGDLPPSLPPMETKPLGAAVGCFGEGGEMRWWRLQDKSLLSWASLPKSPS